MPFIKRKVEPHNIRKHQKVKRDVFEEHTDVVNNALVNALLQLASLTCDASNMFREIEVEANLLFKRCSHVESRIHILQESCMKLSAKAVQIPVSDLDTEFKIPSHLHYRSCDSVDEDLFTTDSRDPCLIHLHNLARSDFSDVFRGSQAYAKPSRPKSFDPTILLDEKTNPDFMLPSKSIANIASAVETAVDGASSILPTPEKRMQMESAQHKAEIITVDTSGSQFDRRANFRRSQKSSAASTRRKNQSKKERHKTLTALPDHVSREFGIYGLHRPSSLHSDLNSNSSFLGDSSVVSGDSSLSPRENYAAENRPDILPSSPVRRRLKNRHSMPAMKSMPDLPQRGARVSLHQPVTRTLSTFPTNPSKKKDHVDNTITNGRLSSSEAETNQQQLFMSEKNMAEDRISSGFWSGTESCRHSTTSEILIQHQNVTHALQQVLSHKPHFGSDENRNKTFDIETNASTLSLNSRLSVLEPASTLSSMSRTPPTERTSTPDETYRISREEERTPSQLNFSSPSGAYDFMNANFSEQPPQLPHLPSPTDLLILGSRRGNDGNLRNELHSFDSSYTPNADLKTQNNQTPYTASVQTPLQTVFSPKIPQQSVEKFNSTLNTVNPHQQQLYPVVGANSSYVEQCFDSPRGFFSSKDSRKEINQDYDAVFSPRTTSQFFRTTEVINLPHQRTTGLSDSSNQNQFFGSNFGANKDGDSSKVERYPGDVQTELKARLEKEKRNDFNSKPLLPRRQSSLRSRHKEVKEILADMKPLSNVGNSLQTTSENCSSVSSNINHASIQSSPSQASVSSNQYGSADSSPRSYSSSYQPSKTVASQLQAKRPTTMYDFPLGSSSGNPKRPVSVVEPVPKSSSPALTTLQTSQNTTNYNLSPKQISVDKISESLPMAQADGREISVFQASCISAAALKPLTPKTPDSSKFSEPPSALEDISSASLQQSTSPTVSSKNISKMQRQLAGDETTGSENFDRPPGHFPFSPALLQATGKSLRKTMRKHGETDKKNLYNSPPKSVTTPSLLSLNGELSSKFQSLSSMSKPTSNLLATSEVQTSAATSKTSSLFDTQLKQTSSLEPKQPDIGVQTKFSPAKKPPVAAKPGSVKKPAVKPKPLLSPRSTSQVVNKANSTNNGIANKQEPSKNSDLKTKKASLRAAFFSVSSSPNGDMADKIAKSTDVAMKDKIAGSHSVNNEIPKKCQVKAETSSELAKGVDDYTTTTAANEKTIFDSVFKESIPVTISDNVAAFAIKELNKSASNEEHIAKPDNGELTPVEISEETVKSSNSVKDTVKNNAHEDSISSLSSSDSVIQKTKINIEKTSTEISIDNTEKQICNGLNHDDSGVEQQSSDSLTADDFNSPISTAKSDIKASMQKLRSSYFSTSATSDYSSGNKSPSNFLDRKSNFRFSTSSLERRRKTSSNAALREDFKALLLQNLPKSNSGSQMSATEKLKIAKQSPIKPNSTLNGDDVHEGRATASNIVPLSDTRSNMSVSRPGRRPNRMSDHRKSYTSNGGFLTKKHPPISSSGRYYTRSRTPTRPMMAITEDSETETSPEKPSEELQRSKSVGDF